MNKTNNSLEKYPIKNQWIFVHDTVKKDLTFAEDLLFSIWNNFEIIQKYLNNNQIQ